MVALEDTNLAALILQGILRAPTISGTPPVILRNHFQGTDGATVTAAGSGGASGDAFDVTSGGSLVTYNRAKRLWGSSCMHAAVAGSTTAIARYSSTSFGVRDAYFARQYFRFVGLPSTTNGRFFFQAGPATNAQWGLAINAAGLLSVRDLSAGADRLVTGITPTQDVWHRAEWHHWKHDDGLAEVHLRLFLDGNLHGTVPNFEDISAKFSQLDSAAQWNVGIGFSANDTWDTYSAGFMLRTDDWPGPYVTSIAPVGIDSRTESVQQDRAVQTLWPVGVVTDDVVVFEVVYGSGGTPTTISQAGGTTATLVSDLSDTSLRTATYLATYKVGALPPSFTLSTARSWATRGKAFRGVHPLHPLGSADTDFQQTAQASGTSYTSGTLTPSEPNAAVVTAWGGKVGASIRQTITVASGWTDDGGISQSDIAAVTNVWADVQYKLLGAASPQSEAVTITDAAVGQGTILALAPGIEPLVTNVNVGQALETDAAQPIGRTKSRAVGQALETDTAGTITPRKSRTLGQAVETDTATAVQVRPIKVQLGQALETDTATALGRRKARATGQALETDTATVTGRRKARTLTQALETDTATATGRSKARSVAMATETDTAQPLGRSKRRAAGQALETDTAGVVTPGGVHNITVNRATETDTATAVQRLKARAVQQAVETDTATVVAHTRKRTVNQALEADTARALVPAKARPMGQVLETSTAFAVTRRKLRALVQALELNEALPITRLGGLILGPWTQPHGTAVNATPSGNATQGRNSTITGGAPAGGAAAPSPRSSIADITPRGGISDRS